uniref:Uncharacterized protein n=1 Tax=Steinernema glaseri TaxID=37863 RepID=A0A1I7YY28_9BILA
MTDSLGLYRLDHGGSGKKGGGGGWDAAGSTTAATRVGEGERAATCTPNSSAAAAPGGGDRDAVVGAQRRSRTRRRARSRRPRRAASGRRHRRLSGIADSRTRERKHAAETTHPGGAASLFFTITRSASWKEGVYMLRERARGSRIEQFVGDARKHVIIVFTSLEKHKGNYDEAGSQRIACHGKVLRFPKHYFKGHIVD